VPLFIHFIKPSPSVSGGAKFVFYRLPELRNWALRALGRRQQDVLKTYLVSDTVFIPLDEDTTGKKEE
jgi:hypothetical protein